MLSQVLSRFWWMMLLRGVVAMLFGIAVLAQPGLSLVTFALLFGSFAFVDGIGNIASALGGRAVSSNWWVLLLSGLAGIIVGVLTFFNPGATALVLLYYIAVWAIVTGLLAIVAAIHLRKEIKGEFWMALAGLASVLFGLLLIVRPGDGALAVLSLIGGYSIVFGAMLVALALKARAFAGNFAAAVKGGRSPRTA